MWQTDQQANSYERSFKLEYRYISLPATFSELLCLLHKSRPSALQLESFLNTEDDDSDSAVNVFCSPPASSSSSSSSASFDVRTKSLLLLALIDVGVGVTQQNLDFLLRQLRRCNCCGENEDGFQFDEDEDEDEDDNDDNDNDDDNDDNDNGIKRRKLLSSSASSSAGSRSTGGANKDLIRSLRKCRNLLKCILTTTSIRSLQVIPDHSMNADR